MSGSLLIGKITGINLEMHEGQILCQRTNKVK
jgi:hypothetical protein